MDVLTEREPLGVVSVISPWKFPIAIASWTIAPALAFGNAMVWKPASITPARALTEIISRQAILKGLFNLVMGSGSTIGRELAADADIQGLSFTGSGAVSSGIAALAAARFVKLQLEMVLPALFFGQDLRANYYGNQQREFDLRTPSEAVYQSGEQTAVLNNGKLDCPIARLGPRSARVRAESRRTAP